MGVSVGGTGVAVVGIGVAVGGIGVAVGGRGVAVGGTGVSVGGTGVAVGGIGVSVAGTGVLVAGIGVAVGGAVAAGVTDACPSFACTVRATAVSTAPGACVGSAPLPGDPTVTVQPAASNKSANAAISKKYTYREEPFIALPPMSEEERGAEHYDKNAPKNLCKSVQSVVENSVSLKKGDCHPNVLFQ